MRNVVAAVLVVVFFASVAVYGFMSEKVAARNVSVILEWLVSLWKWWCLSWMIFILFCRFGPKLDYNEVPSVVSIFHWRNFPGNWRELYLLLTFITGYALLCLSIGYINQYGSTH